MRTSFHSVGVIGPLLAGCLLLGACTHTVKTFDEGSGANVAAPVRNASKEEVAKSLVRVADSLRERGEYDTAIGVYQRAQASDPRDPAIPLGLAKSLWAVGDWEDAGRAYQEALNFDPDSHEAQIGVANALLATGRLDEAAKQFKSLIAKAPEDPKTYNGLGIAYDLQGKHDEAQLNYGMGLEVAPKNIGLKNNLAVSFALAHDYATAIELLRGMPDNPKTRQNMALVYGLENKPKLAAKMASEDLDEQAVQNNLAYYAWLRGLSGEAQAEAVLLGHQANNDGQPQPRKTAATSTNASEPSVPAVPAIPAETKPLAEAAGPVGSKSVKDIVPVNTGGKMIHVGSSSKEKPVKIPENPPAPAFGTHHATPAAATHSDADDALQSAEITAPSRAPVRTDGAPEPQSEEIIIPQSPASSAKTADKATAKANAQKLYQAQLASFHTYAETEGVKNKLERKHGDLLNGFDLVIEQADLGPSKGSYHRLRTAPVADKSSTQALCKALKATGTACYVVQVTGQSASAVDHQG